MLNLLSLQAELVDLQVQFRDLWAEDDTSTDSGEKQFSTYFRVLRNSENSLQYDKLLEIRQKLQDYNAALIQTAQIGRMPQPEQSDVQFLRDWLGGIDEGENFLHGSEMYTWELPTATPSREHKFLEKDLLTLYKATEEQDVFSRILSSSILDFWNWLRTFRSRRQRQILSSSTGLNFQKSIDPQSGILHYSDSGLLRFNNILISVISAALPIAAVVALYFIKTEGGRLGAMAGFTVVFALALACFTNARRLEIAASTAAFAAVEVVFIGSNLGKD
ncbi:hypothetical protein SLS60_007294 [Paraconiothyrium brasiliense]|uniref:DUF6594 domain-containing protein n=1 Tax=Paraconiothyrium brasiliense TaxID=300254 RepID=A0ABR3R503_9PLEO